MKRKTTEEFISEAKLIYGNKYDYSESFYINKRTKVKIICPIHGEFYKTPNKHLANQGCKDCCNTSKGESEILKLLLENDIKFERYKTFDDLKDKRSLSYDFYISDKNTLIEFNGLQHYYNSFNKPIHEWHRQLHHDWLKRKYAKDNNINLLIISYKDDLLDKMKTILK